MISDRLRDLAIAGHPLKKELWRVADGFDAALRISLEPQKKWPDLEKSRVFELWRREAIDLFRQCGGSEDVCG